MLPEVFTYNINTEINNIVQSFKKSSINIQKIYLKIHFLFQHQEVQYGPIQAYYMDKDVYHISQLYSH